VLDDPVDRAADQLVRTLGTKSRDDWNNAASGTGLLPPPQCIDACAAYRHLADTEPIHAFIYAVSAFGINSLAGQPGGHGQAEKGEESH
jgi:hypothetical protein